MERDNSVQKLIYILEPLIKDLDEKKMILENKKNELENVSRLLAYTKDNYESLGIYADQELIVSSFDEIGCSNEKYKASCYLLQSEDENVKRLPQYGEARELMSDIIEYFRLHKLKLIDEIKELKELCERKELEKKYYDILSSTNPLINDISEFEIILNNYGLTEEEKIDVLMYVLKNNISCYKLESK